MEPPNCDNLIYLWNSRLTEFFPLGTVSKDLRQNKIIRVGRYLLSQDNCSAGWQIHTVDLVCMNWIISGVMKTNDNVLSANLPHIPAKLLSSTFSEHVKCLYWGRRRYAPRTPRFLGTGGLSLARIAWRRDCIDPNGTCARTSGLYLNGEIEM